MKLALIGLGKMGLNMAQRLLAGGHEVIVYDLNTEAVRQAETAGARGAQTLETLVAALEAPRILWLMVPAGEPTEKLINELAPRLEPGDILIDGGNSNYRDSMRRAALLKAMQISFLDVGVSGGVWGRTEGYSLMIGGDPQATESLRPLFETLAPAADQGWGHVGRSGAGHFTKMIHNGIEYGLMQAYAEGFELLQGHDEFDLDLHQIAEIWRYGSVVRSWLLDLAAAALAEDPELSDIRGWVADSGEGRWTVHEAIEMGIPAPVITLALQMRFASRQDESYAAKLLAALRNQFGGHAVKKID